MSKLKMGPLSLSFLMIMLSNCASPTIEKKYDELDKRVTCRLNGLRVTGPVSLMLDMQDDGHVSAFFEVHSLNYLHNMHVNPKIMFKIYNNKQVEELNFQGTTKNWLEEAQENHKSNKSLPPFTPGNPYNLHYATIRMDKASFSKIAQADKIEILIETNHDPARASLLKEELEYFREFKKVCFNK